MLSQVILKGIGIVINHKYQLLPLERKFKVARYKKNEFYRSFI